MQLANQPACISGVCKQRGDKWSGLCPALVTVHAAMNAAGIHAGEEAGAARGANGALAVCPCKRNTVSNETVDVRRSNVIVPQAGNRVVALLIGTNPENVGRSRHGFT
jgi:hypothetical protein